jgi:hypothetical protein
LLHKHRSEVIDPAIAKHRGRIVKLMGDGLLAEFSSVVEAVDCAAEIQRAMAARNGGSQGERQMAFRVGVHLGDIIVEGDDLYGMASTSRRGFLRFGRSWPSRAWPAHLLGSPTSLPTNATGYPFAMTLRQVGSYQSWTYGAVRSMLLVATAQEPSRGRPHEQNSRHRRQ